MVRYDRQHWVKEKRKEKSIVENGMRCLTPASLPDRWGGFASGRCRRQDRESSIANTGWQISRCRNQPLDRLVVKISSQSPRSSAPVTHSIPLDDDGAGVDRLRVDSLPIIEGRPRESNPRYRSRSVDNQPITADM